MPLSSKHPKNPSPFWDLDFLSKLTGLVYHHPIVIIFFMWYNQSGKSINFTQKNAKNVQSG